MTWHVLIDGEQRGPLEANTVAQMIRRGEVNTDSLVWTAGMEDWTRAIDVPEFAGKFAGAPPPPQPLRYGAEQTDDDDGAPGRLKIGRVFSDAFKGLAARPEKTLLIATVYAGFSVVLSIPTYVIINPKIYAAAESSGGFDLTVFNGSDITIYFVSMVAMIAVYGGVCAAMIDLFRGGDASTGRMISGFARIVPLLLYTIMFSIFMIVGLILLVLPGLFVWGVLMLGIFIIMDRGVGAIAATKASFRAALRLGFFRVVGLVLLIIVMMSGIAIVFGVIAGIGAGLSTGSAAGAAVFTQSIAFSVIQTVITSMFMMIVLALICAAYEQAEPHIDAP